MRPILSSTHLLWAQASGDKWNVKLRELSAGATSTIVADLPTGVDVYSPALSMGGDDVTAKVEGANTWYLHQISTGTNRVFTAAFGVTTVSVATDGVHVVLQTDDGDLEIQTYDIATGEWTKVTNNATDDVLFGLKDGQLIWERVDSSGYRLVVYSLETRSQKIVASRAFEAGAILYARVTKHWAGFFDMATDKLCFHRLDDGFELQTEVADEYHWLLTDDYAFWMQERPGGTGMDLYALDLATLEKTRVTDDIPYEVPQVADGGRMVYVKPTTVIESWDLWVVDAGESGMEPQRLAPGVSFPDMAPTPVMGLGWLFSLSGDLLAATLSDGNDGEICWARYTGSTPGGGGDDGGAGGDGGDGGDGGSGTAFPDVPAGHPYYNAIYDLADRGIIAGYEDGTFGPGDPVTRQQFAKMIVKTLGYTVTGTEVCPVHRRGRPRAAPIPSTPPSTWRCAPPTASPPARRRPPSPPRTTSPVSSSSPWWPAPPASPTRRPTTRRPSRPQFSLPDHYHERPQGRSRRAARRPAGGGGRLPLSGFLNPGGVRATPIQPRNEVGRRHHKHQTTGGLSHERIPGKEFGVSAALAGIGHPAPDTADADVSVGFIGAGSSDRP